jgi:phospholipid/cholesterol/gamma-HCH transport system substrate-binding protein
MEEQRLELKVGILVLVGALGCAGLLWLLGVFRLAGGSRVKVDFAHSGSVPEGAPVKLAGVRVGRVAGLRLLPARREADGSPLPVQMEVEIDEAVFRDLKADASFVVATQGPLGEPYLEIAPGSPAAGPLAAGAVLRGVDPPRMDLISSKLFAFLDGATDLVGQGPGVKSALGRVAALAAKAEGTIDEARPLALQAVRDLANAAKDLKALAATAAATLSEQGSARTAIANVEEITARLRSDLPRLSEKAQRAMDGAAAVAGSFTEEDAQRLKEAITGYKKAGETLGEVACRADRLLARLEAGDGTAGALAKDPKLYEDLRDLVADLKKHPWKVLWKD